MFTLFNHVGIVVRDLDSATRLWVDLFGLKVVDRFELPDDGVVSVILSTNLPYGQATCIELMQPLDETKDSSPMARWLAEHGEGVYHLAFRLPDNEVAGRDLRAAGLQIYEVPATGPEPQQRLIVHPRSANGVLLELLAGTPTTIAANGGHSA